MVYSVHRLLGVLAAMLLVPALPAASLTPAQQQMLAQAHRFERSGWIYVHLEGDAQALGFQHGYLLAPEIAEGLGKTRQCWEHDTAMEWSWLLGRVAGMFVPRIDAETLAELDGLVEGLRAAGQTVTREDIVAYNAIFELNGYWWPTVAKSIKKSLAPPARESCSAFIATGRMTRDGNIVIGHNTMQSYAEAFPNVIADIQPSRGHRILWQTTAGWIHSGTDFFITDAGLVGTETTIGGFEGFETNAIPEFVRLRRATQDADNIDGWCAIMRRGNNGGYANAWLLGDLNTHEIARLELGLKCVAFEKKTDGYFIGSNVAEDLKLLRFETNIKETDIRLSSVARRERWKQLMQQYAGRIDVKLAKQFEADHYDSWRETTQAGGRSLCSHQDLDREAYGTKIPFACSGTVDGKVADATMARQMSFAARWGSACGTGFSAAKYLAAHGQFDWTRPILRDRPAQPWAVFRCGE